ncbi:MAG: lipocalin family protein [Chryseobacterium sp.]|uniref:lipocalin family protein n=1 Tax=Chryseobacterium sp. TaxID=1871047 RepID=UPI001B065FB1|nr:lipocalin family protein [Chryseobacterium sp.]MBO6183725.1 lipocalin family protein [Chryseobacterium sp.]
MKKILLLAVVVGFVFNSCKKDDDDDKSHIVGTWKIEKYFYKYANGTSDTELPDACDSKTQITFKEDGSIINDEFSTGGNGACVSDYETGTYSYNESSKVLSINLGNSTDEFKVLTLNNSQLAFQDESGDYDGDGVNDVYIGYLKR